MSTRWYAIFSCFIFRVVADDRIVHKCLEQDVAGIYEKREFFQLRLCYFIIKGATELSSKVDEDGLFMFNFTIASDICQSHGGQLPVIWNEDENDFLANFVSSEENVALGYVAVKYMTGKWIDGSQNYYLPPKVTHLAYNGEEFYYAVLLPQSRMHEWYVLPLEYWSVNRTKVVCEWQYKNSETPVDNCLAPKDKRLVFLATKLYERPKSTEYVCNFIIKDADNMTNNHSTNSKYIFDANYARSVCKSQRGVLPIIRSAEEEKATVDFVKQHLPQAKRIALGLQFKGDDLTWDDGTTVTYKPSSLAKANQPGLFNAFLMLHQAQSTWVAEKVGEETSMKTFVVCHQAHEISYADVPNVNKTKWRRGEAISEHKQSLTIMIAFGMILLVCIDYSNQ